MSCIRPITLILFIVHHFSFMPVRCLFALVCYSNKCQLSLFENWNKLQHFRSLTAIRHFATDSIFSNYKSWNRIWCVPRPVNFYLWSLKWNELPLPQKVAILTHFGIYKNFNVAFKMFKYLKAFGIILKLAWNTESWNV